MVAIRGKALIKLLLAEEYVRKRTSRHGEWLEKHEDGRTRHTIVKDNNEVIPQGTLNNILGPQQTGLGMRWLREKLGQK